MMFNFFGRLYNYLNVYYAYYCTVMPTQETLENLIQSLTKSELESLKVMIDTKLKDDINKEHANDIMLQNDVFTLTNFSYDTNYVEGSDIEATYNSIYYGAEIAVNHKIRLSIGYTLEKKKDYNFEGCTIDLIIKTKVQSKTTKKVRSVDKVYSITFDKDDTHMRFSRNALMVLDKLKIEQTNSNKLLLGVLLNNLLFKMYELTEEYELSDFKKLIVGSDGKTKLDYVDDDKNRCDMVFTFDYDTKENSE